MKRELKIFDNPANVKRLLYVFYGILVLLIVLDLLLGGHAEGGHAVGGHAVGDEHGFPCENMPAFFAVYGFVSYVTLIFVAKGLRLLIKRDEDYYE